MQNNTTLQQKHNIIPDNNIPYSELAVMLSGETILSKSSCSFSDNRIDIREIPFSSTFRNIFPNSGSNSSLSPGSADEEISENNNFSYLFFSPHGKSKIRSVIFLLHGLNERFWDKYLTWAYFLAEKTGSAVILFPTAFHMNRAPDSWANPRIMNELSKKRRSLFPDMHCSSFANAAISDRLQTAPSRLCYSGLQTIKDITSLVRSIKSGKHQSIDKSARIDLFGYSIGGFIGEILLHANPVKMFADSRLVLFCGGSTLDRTNPVSRMIMDSQAMESIANYYGPMLEHHLAADERLAQTFKTNESEASVFSFMTHSEMNSKLRSSSFSKIRKQIRSITLSKDTVMYPEGVRNTINASAISHKTLDTELDFPFEYSHENPFPLKTKNIQDVNNAFEKTFGLAVDFLN